MIRPLGAIIVLSITPYYQHYPPVAAWRGAINEADYPPTAARQGDTASLLPCGSSLWLWLLIHSNVMQTHKLTIYYSLELFVFVCLPNIKTYLDPSIVSEPSEHMLCSVSRPWYRMLKQAAHQLQSDSSSAQSPCPLSSSRLVCHWSGRGWCTEAGYWIERCVMCAFIDSRACLKRRSIQRLLRGPQLGPCLCRHTVG